MKKLKQGVQEGFERIKAAATDGVLKITTIELGEKIIFRAQPIQHLRFMEEAGFISLVIPKKGQCTPIEITILKTE
tara:strand:- start:46221 stop:46448 length:228 start_codon:yes stop_codon:yes gene_type:complete